MTTTDRASGKAHAHTLTETDKQIAAEAKTRSEADAAIDARVSADVNALDAADSALDARISATMAAHVAQYHKPIEPEPEPPDPNQKVVQFPTNGSTTTFLSMMRDLDLDVIEMAGGGRPWALIDHPEGVPRPADRPLLVRTRPNEHVIFDGTGTINTPPFRIGWSALISNIRFDAAGTGGSFTIQNYKLGKVGALMARYYNSVAFNGFIVLPSVEGGFGDGIPGQQQHTHAVYLSTDGSHRSKNFTANGWDVIGPANRMLNGLQTDGSPNADGVTAKGWKVRSLHRAVYAWSNPTGIVIDGWDIADCNVTIDNNKGQQTSQGVVSNCKAVRSGPLANGQGMWGGTRLVDGGGNTSA